MRGFDIPTEAETRRGTRLLRQAFRRKNINRVVQILEQNELNPTLGLKSLVSLGVGAVVGAGVFVITGQAAALYAGPALSISFLLCIFPCAFTGLCYGELSAMVPVAGSAYTHCALAIGEFASWLVAVCLTLENLVSGSAVAVSWSASVLALMNELYIPFPALFSRSPLAVDGNGFRFTGSLINLPAVAITGLCTMVLIVGINESATVNNVFVVVKLGVLAVFILYGLYYASMNWEVFSSNLTPFIPPNTGTFGEFGVSGILRGAGVVFFANVGFDTICATAQECITPRRDLPRSVLLTLFICAFLYFTVTIVLTGLMPYTQLHVDDPVIEALAHVHAPGVIRVLVDLGTISGLTSVCLLAYLAMPRLLLTLANDGMLPAYLAAVHPQYKTPVRATIATGIAGATIAGLFPLDMLGELISFGTLVAFTGVCVSMWRMRVMHPDYPRPFRVHFFPVIPFLGITFNVLQLLCLPFATWRNYFVVLFFSTLWYIFYARHHSQLEKNTPPSSPLCFEEEMPQISSMDKEDTRDVAFEGENLPM